MGAERTGDRLVSLDVFRGVTVAAMLVVNNPGSSDLVSSQLRHAPWFGWTVTDLIAPAFLWIVGVALPFSLARWVPTAGPQGASRRVVRRGAVLFGIGVLLNAWPEILPLGRWEILDTLRIPGTLQRIALCYVVASLIVLHTSVRGQVLWAVALPIVYWTLMLAVPVPGYGAGDLSRDGNLHQYVNQLVLGAHAQRYDELGVLSTMSAVGTTLLGVVAGHWLRAPGDSARRAAVMFVSGALAMTVGLGLNPWVPISRDLWTPSFTLLTAGVSLAIFATFHWLLDLRLYRRWARPFVILGRNALVLFVVSQLAATVMNGKGLTGVDGRWVSLHGYVYQWILDGLGDRSASSLAYALAWLGLCLAGAYLLYRRRWFVRA